MIHIHCISDEQNKVIHTCMLNLWHKVYVCWAQNHVHMPWIVSWVGTWLVCFSCRFRFSLGFFLIQYICVLIFFFSSFRSFSEDSFLYWCQSFIWKIRQAKRIHWESFPLIWMRDDFNSGERINWVNSTHECYSLLKLMHSLILNSQSNIIYFI